MIMISPTGRTEGRSDILEKHKARIKYLLLAICYVLFLDLSLFFFIRSKTMYRWGLLLLLTMLISLG